VHFDWWSSGAGFLDMSYRSTGNARATLTVEVSSETVLEGETLAEECEHVTAMQEGRFAVSLTDVAPGRTVPLGATTGERAEVFYADLHLPGHALYAWHDG
jgi:hypothetical protein